MLTIVLKTVFCECGHKCILAPYELREIGENRGDNVYVMCMRCETRRRVIQWNF